jgi:hypothetical protein
MRDRKKRDKSILQFLLGNRKEHMGEKNNDKSREQFLLGNLKKQMREKEKGRQDCILS